MYTFLRSTYMVSFLRWGLRLHGAFHVFELTSALLEGAYITAVIVFFAGSIELLSSFIIPHEHTHHKQTTSKISQIPDE